MNSSGKIIRTILSLSALGIILVCLTVSWGISRQARTGTLCSGIEVSITDSTESRFVSGKDILEYISEDYGKTEGIPVENLDLDRMEQMLDSRSAVLKSEAYCTKDGTLHILITQRKPVMRLQKGSEGFYVDREGYIFPIRPGRSGYVVVIDGNIPLELDKTTRGKAASEKERLWLEQLTGLVGYMDGHRIWEDNIVQIHVRENGDLVLIPREGKEKFIFGKPDRIAEKFALMDCYYTNIVPARGNDRYRTVDIRYDRQIICK